MNKAYRQFLMDGYEAGTRYFLRQPPSAPRGCAGNELGRAAGSSLEFMEHRDYLPGDDLRRLDWSVYARTDRLAVKLFREEVCPHVDILLDGSRSMALEGTEKARAALGLVGLLCSASESAGYSHTVWLASEGCRKIPNSQSPPLAWEDLTLDSDVPLPESLHGMPPEWRARSIRFIVSDLFFLGDTSIHRGGRRGKTDHDPSRIMMGLVNQSANTAVLQVLAREDAEPPAHGNVRLEDSETGELYEIYLDAAARRRYIDNLSRHQENWSLACRQHGALFTTLIAERVAADWRLDDLLAAEYLRFT